MFLKLGLIVFNTENHKVIIYLIFLFFMVDIGIKRLDNGNLGVCSSTFNEDACVILKKICIRTCYYYRIMLLVMSCGVIGIVESNDSNLRVTCIFLVMLQRTAFLKPSFPFYGHILDLVSDVSFMLVLEFNLFLVFYPCIVNSL